MYIIIGARGYLGAYFIKNILESTSENIIAASKSADEREEGRVRWVQLDVSDSKSIMLFNEKYFQSHKDNKVIYLVAYHHPDLVEKNPRIAWDINVTTLSRFLNIADNVSKFYYPSTDSVYGNSVDGHAFIESDALKPVNRYGVHKCVAEKLVTGYGYHVVRFPFLISASLIPGKPHFYDTIVSTIKGGKTFDLFADSYRSTISFDQAAKYTLRLMNMNISVPQIVNVCSDKGYSKYDVGLMIADKVGVSKNLINPISFHKSQGIFEAKRASSTLMDNSLLKKIVGEDEIELKL